VPSSQTVSELTYDTCYNSGLAQTDVVDDVDDKLLSDEMLVHAADAVVPCHTDVQHEAACRVAKYLSQFCLYAGFSIIIY